MMEAKQTTLADLKLTELQMQIMEDFRGHEGIALPGIGSPNPYYRLVDKPGRLGLLEPVRKPGERIRYRLTDKGRKILAGS